MQLNRPMPVLSTEPFRFDPLQQDRGFAQMLEQEMAVKGASETDSRAMMALTDVEQSLLNRWSIPDYDRIFEVPEIVMRETAADFERFEERARQVAYEMMRYDVQAMVDIRFGVGGISTRLDDNFLLSDLSMTQLWNVERQIFGWGQNNHRVVHAITGLGVKHSLAMAVSAIEHEQGLNRLQASASGVLEEFVQQLLLIAGNSTGFNPILPYQASVEGCDLSCALGAKFDPRSASFAELRGVAKSMLQQGRVGIESYSLMTHVHQLFGLETTFSGSSHNPAQVNWIDVFEGFLGSAPISGEARLQVHNTLAFLQELSNR